MNHWTFPTILFLFAAACSRPSFGTENAITILHATAQGYLFESRPDFPAGEYLALRCSDSCALTKTTLVIKKEKVATHEGEIDGYVARTTKNHANLFLIRGLRKLVEGPVKTWYSPPRILGAVTVGQHNLTMTNRQELSVDIDGALLTILGSVSWMMDRSCAADEPCPKFPQVRWRFRYSGVERTLGTHAGSELGEPLGIQDYVVWIGDLDGDGKPDLMVRPQDRADYLELALYLSGALTPGTPWRPASRFYWWDPANPGC